MYDTGQHKTSIYRMGWAPNSNTEQALDIHVISSSQSFLRTRSRNFNKQREQRVTVWIGVAGNGDGEDQGQNWARTSKHAKNECKGFVLLSFAHPSIWRSAFDLQTLHQVLLDRFHLHVNFSFLAVVDPFVATIWVLFCIVSLNCELKV